MATTKKSAPPAEQVVLVGFVSDYSNLIMYRKGVRIAAFVNGQFATSDPEVIAALRASDLVREVLDEAAP